MSYTKTTWSSGDVITAEKLNKLENGIATSTSNSSEDLIVHFTVDKDGNVTLIERYDFSEEACVEISAEELRSFGLQNIKYIYMYCSGDAPINGAPIFKNDPYLTDSYLQFGILGTLYIDTIDLKAYQTFYEISVDIANMGVSIKTMRAVSTLFNYFPVSSSQQGR